MKEELLAAKDRTLMTRVAAAILNLLRKTLYVTEEMPGTSNEECGKGNGKPDFYTLAVKQLPSRVSAFGAILQKHLRSRTPIEKWEYLFMALVIQREARVGQHQISRERLIELLELEKELFQLYQPRYPDVHYLITNLRDYRTVGKDDDVLTALDKEIAHTKCYCAGEMIGFDLMARNLLALLEESGTLDNELLLATLSKYDETLLTLTSRIIYQEETGSTASYEDCLATKLSIKKTGDWFSLHVTSDQRYFAAVIETMTHPVFVIPVNYRWFASMTTPKKLQTLDRSDDLMLHLPGDIRMFLTQGQAEEFKNACQRVYSRADYQAHARILSWLNGTAI